MYLFLPWRIVVGHLLLKYANIGCLLGRQIKMKNEIKSDVLSEGICRFAVVKDGMRGTALNQYGFIGKVRSSGKNRGVSLEVKKNGFLSAD